jgi:hypothetical protein
MRDEETDITVKHAAAKALENALEFAKENFKVPVCIFSFLGVQ